MGKKFAVILCGSGFLDGSEIREAVGTLWALSLEGVETQCFAPNLPQHHVMNCLTRDEAKSESRNMLVESARIARSQVKPLNELKVTDFDGLLLPGGFGAAKNLCTFAFHGSNAKVLPELEQLLHGFHAKKKPIGAVCIAPAIVALAFKGKGFELTVGEKGEAAMEIEKLGHHVKVCKANEAHIDSVNRIVTTPAYMYDSAPLHEIFDGIKKLVHEVVRLA